MKVNIEYNQRRIMSNIKVEVEIENITDSTKRWYHTNRLKEDRIPTPIEKRKHHRYNPTKRNKYF